MTRKLIGVISIPFNAKLSQSGIQHSAEVLLEVNHHVLLTNLYRMSLSLFRVIR